MASQGSASARPALSLRIGEVARRTGLPVKTIRFYCDAGLLQPKARSEGGYRLFDQENLAELAIIRALRAMDVSIPRFDENPGSSAFRCLQLLRSQAQYYGPDGLHQPAHR